MVYETNARGWTMQHLISAMTADAGGGCFRVAVTAIAGDRRHMAINLMFVQVVTTVLGAFADVVLVAQRRFELIAHGVAVVTGALAVAHAADAAILPGQMTMVVSEIDGMVEAAEGKIITVIVAFVAHGFAFNLRILGMGIGYFKGAPHRRRQGDQADGDKERIYGVTSCL